MWLLSKLFKKSKVVQAAISTPEEQTRQEKGGGLNVCTGCAKEIALKAEGLFDTGDIYCSECTKLKQTATDYTANSDPYEVFVFSYPWNEFVRSYVLPRRQWLPVYQADIGSFTLSRTVERSGIPADPIFASIIVAVSSHGSFTYSRNVLALIAIQEQSAMLCAYVRKDMYRRQVRF